MSAYNSRIIFIIAALLTVFPVLGQKTKLEEQIIVLSAPFKAKIGVTALVLETEEILVSFHGGDRFPMQSVYKFPIAMAILNEVDQGRLQLHQKIKVEPSEIIPRGVSPIREKYPQGAVLTLSELLRLNIVDSDGTACDVLLRIMGGTAKVQHYLNSLGITGINIATTEMVQVSDDWIQYQNWSTPDAMTQLLYLFYSKKVLSTPSRLLLLKWMEESIPGAKRLKGALPKNAIVAHKPGTSGTNDGLTRATNDVGIITLPNGNHLAISVFVADTYVSREEREGLIAAIAKMAWDY
ncbi:class A beta-lactamase [Flavobacterium kingsejongi]|uniref:Beta-lactamase n=1 Tax=Flavobacterium kingsejongi TaxID=1678728 RepID=A0A2S1LS47_9FLAO|nr:class A beta-lactamase [Flavobacterium kingsejongi]AWG26544.1 hypothetical protein FK004_15580 [Flavobacterium kingsejongi]